MFNDPILR